MKQESRDFWRSDPILETLKGRLRLSDAQIIILAVAFTGICHYVLGGVADYYYTGRGGVTEPGYLYFTLAWLLVFTPIVWAFYLWQPRAVDRVLDDLEEHGMIGGLMQENEPPVKSLGEFRERFASAVAYKRWYVIALLLVTLFWVYAYYYAWPREFQRAGGPDFWFEVGWFTPFFVLGSSLTFYVLWVFGLRHIQIIYYFNRLFHWFRANVKPVYPDEAGGLGAIGDFTVREGMIAVGVGVLAMAYGLHVWANYGSFIRPDVLSLFIAYVVITVLSLVLPMWSAHRAMKEARSKSLEEISREFSRILSELNATLTADAEVIEKTNQKLSQLKQTYQLVYDAFPVWPVSVRVARNFSLTATLPLLSGLVSVVIEYVVS